MEYIIIILLVFLIIIELFKKTSEIRITEKLSELKITTIKELNNSNKELTENFINLNEKIEKKLSQISDKVNERINDNFDKTNKTFANLLERLTKIDEAQKKIDLLSQDIVSLQSILTDKKTRGIYGEVNLRNILSNVFGDNSKVYTMQYNLPNKTIVDAVLFAPEPLGLIGIDSKFPLENYQKMVDNNYTSDTRKNFEKQFISDVKKHIDAIADKYIINDVTSNQAIMFLPAEAIFAYINAYTPQLVEYANKKRIWMTSPTTLMSTLTTIQVILVNIERDKHANIIHQELNQLGIEFKRYKDRWDKLSRSIETVSKDVSEIHTTTEKITRKFNNINQVELENKD